MRYNTEWKDYSVIATGDGMKLERWGKNIILLRPDPQVIWKTDVDMYKYNGLTAYYSRSNTGGGMWHYKRDIDEFTVSWRNLKFKLKLMGFKHTGLFPEQAVNWSMMINLISKANRPIKVLNLFAYTGGATLACMSAGAKVTHVDSARAMIDRAKENIKLSNLDITNARFIQEDCVKFVQREIRRGNKYDAIIMDPPSFGRGPNGEKWKIEEEIFSLVEICKQVLSDEPLFFLINSYTTGLQPQVLNNILTKILKDYKGYTYSYEVGLPTEEKGIILPAGASGLWSKEKIDE